MRDNKQVPRLNRLGDYHQGGERALAFIIDAGFFWFCPRAFSPPLVSKSLSHDAFLDIYAAAGQ